MAPTKQLLRFTRVLCKLVKLCIDPEMPELLLGKLRAWDVMIVLAGSSWRFGEICLEMDAAESLQENIRCASFFPLLITAQILLSAWGLGQRERWLSEVI